MPLAHRREDDIRWQLRHACGELDRQLRDMQTPCRPPRVESFLARFPLLACRPDYAVELIYTEFTAREELGQRPTPEEYYLRFPQWKEPLLRQFGVHEWLRNSVGNDTLSSSTLAPQVQESNGLPCPRWVGPYEILDVIVNGIHATVYKAWQHGLDRAVAIKVLPAEHNSSLEVRQRFCHEARVMAGLQHPHIVTVHDIGENHGTVYFSMEFLGGGSLADRLTDASGAASGPPRRITPATAVRWLASVAEAIHYVHERQIIHRDLKPSNILFDDRGEPKVSDFGLAYSSAMAEDGHECQPLAGTPVYMAPEQICGSRGQGPQGVSMPCTPPRPLLPGCPLAKAHLADPDTTALTPATDIWALGVTLYEMLTGTRPFLGRNFMEIREEICSHEPPPLQIHHSDLDSRLDDICRRCLAKNPAHRYPSAALLADDLRRYLG